MCGIAGAVSLKGPLDPSVAAAITPMTDALAHRGPDGRGEFRDSHAALGHRRLAIIDRARGAQPIANEDESCWIVFNGEIYNHKELRQKLVDRGHRYRTASDTETILHAYEEYGTSCVERLEGMFAFAIYNRATRELFAARDRLGKKPFFYGLYGDVLLLGSELKSLSASPAWDDEIDYATLEGFLSLGYIIAPHTIYRRARKLLPGHWLRVRDGRIETREYWDVPAFDEDERDERAILEDLESVLSRAVQRRLESEVPLGAFLSGGIDSGLIASFMSNADGRPVITTSVGFSDKEHDELDAAGTTARHLGTQHFSHQIAPNLTDELDRIASAFDEPFADSSAVPTYYVSKIARQHVTVALSGDGGDETFSGYDFRYIPHVVEDIARGWLPGDSGRMAARTLGTVWPRSPKLPRPLRLGSLIENLGRDAAEAYFVDLCFLKPAQTRRLLGRREDAPIEEHPFYEAVTGAYRRCRSSDPLQRAQYADLKIYMPNDPLVKVDRMSMLNSLEVRCPFLDREVVEFAFRLTARRKMPRLRAKHLLRQLAARRLPEKITTLPKHGFTAPAGAWITGVCRDRFTDEVFGSGSLPRSLLDVKIIRQHFDEQRLGIADHSYSLWAIWMLESWGRTAATPAAGAAR